MNKFEQHAANYRRVRRPSWEHTVKTYTGNNESYALEYTVIAVLVLSVIVLVCEHTGLVDMLIQAFAK